MIRLEKISKIYSTEEVLKDINWEVKKGEKIGLVGSNGSGKTTQLKILIGDEEQTTGCILKEGNPKIAYLRQEFELNSKNTVRKELENSFSEIQFLANELLEIEKKLKLLEVSGNKKELDRLVNQLGIYQRKYEQSGGYQMNSEIDKILPILGFSINDADQLVENLSGGWQMKIALGKIMLQKPDLLLLDEPTNHLDLQTISWLEEYLISLKTAIILISHDRYFLDKLCKKIILTEDGISHTYIGNYSSFVQTRNLQEQAKNKAFNLQQKEIESQKKYIERFRASATRSSQAKSREKQLDKVQKISTSLRKIKAPSFNFAESTRSGKKIVEIQNLCHSYGDNLIFFEANLSVNSGDKIAFLGRNGAGKSTLFKFIMKKLVPELGQITLSQHNLIMNYYEQNQADALPAEETVLDLIFENVPNWTQKRVRTLLGGFGFKDDSVFKRVKNLSGGEKARLALALIVIKPSNFLLLDEPTNHLDMNTKENLELALKKYKGTVFLISHDRYFISKIANRIVEIQDCKFYPFNGDYEYYLHKRNRA